MNIEQRQVTTINLQDGKARDFVVHRDGPVCTISGVCGDEVVRVVMSPQDFQRLAHTLGQPVSPECAGSAAAQGSCTAGEAACGCGGQSGIQVERRQVTTVTLVPSRTRDFVLTHDERGCTLTSLAREEVVTLHLSAGDFHKLRHQVAPHSGWTGRRDPAHETIRDKPSYAHGNGGISRARPGLVTLPAGPSPAPGRNEPATPPPASGATRSPYVWTGIDWLGYN